MAGQHSAAGRRPREIDLARARFRRFNIDGDPKERNRVRKKLSGNISGYAALDRPIEWKINKLLQSLKDVEILRERGFFPGEEKRIAVELRRNAAKNAFNLLSKAAGKNPPAEEFMRLMQSAVSEGLLSRARARRISSALVDSLLSTKAPEGTNLIGKIRVLEEKMRVASAILGTFGLPRSRQAEVRTRVENTVSGDIGSEMDIRGRRARASVFDAIDFAKAKGLLLQKSADRLRARYIKICLERIARDEMPLPQIGRIMPKIERIASPDQRASLKAFARKFRSPGNN